jgi:RHS repeat-associated protein
MQPCVGAECDAGNAIDAPMAADAGPLDATTTRDASPSPDASADAGARTDDAGSSDADPDASASSDASTSADASTGADASSDGPAPPTDATSPTDAAPPVDASTPLTDASAPVEAGTVAPVARFTITPDRIAREDMGRTVVTLDASSATGGGLAFEWVVPDGTFVEGTSASAPVARVRFAGDNDHSVLLRVRNGRGASTESGIVRVNRVPVPAVTGSGVANVGAMVSLDARGSTDADGDTLAFRWTLTGRPMGSSAALASPANALTGFVPDLPGEYLAQVVVGDRFNDGPPVTVRVIARSSDRDPPTVRVVPTPSTAPVGSPIRVCVTATDAGGIASVSLSVAGAPVALDAMNCGTFTPSSAGRFEAVASAVDRGGNTGNATADLFASTGSANAPPTVTITAPTAGAALEADTEVIGTVSDTDLALYTLELAPRTAGASFVRIAEGTRPVSAARLGTLSPGRFSPGFYALRACATDTFAQSTCSAPVVVELSAREAAPGVARFSFRDGVVDWLGVPVVLVRTYDSRRATRVGDFGFGWNLSLEGLGTIEQSGDPSTDWQVNGCAGLPFRPTVVATSPHQYSISLAGRTYRFRMDVTSSSCLGSIVPVTISFSPLAGTTGTLALPSAPDVNLISRTTLASSTLEPFAPQDFVLTTPDGYEYTLNLQRGVTRVRDPRGLVGTLSADRIVTAGGEAVTLARDAMGRVTGITMPDGTARAYRYDARGDLESTTDPGGATTRFLYDTRHLLTGIVDPRGGVPGMLVYDATGRITAMVDASGRRIEFTRDDAARREAITDRLGNVTVLFHDARGNVIRRIDPLGNETLYTYDAAGNLTSVTEPDGSVTRFEYDAQNRRTAMVDPLGNRWTTTYDAAGRVLSRIDPLGNSQRTEYNAAGDPTAQIDALGNRTTLAYTGSDLTRVTLPEGATMQFAYDANHRVTSFTNAMGSRSNLTWNRNGELTSDSTMVDLGRGPVPVTYGYAYDPRGSLASVMGPDGATAGAAYDTAGRMTGTMDPDGRGQSVTYDATGAITSVSGPDGARTQATYDVEGRLSGVTFPDGTPLRATLDGLGRATRVDLPGGSSLRYTYDGAGRITAMTDLAGMTSAFAYDRAGRVSRVTYGDGSSVAYERDAAGRVTAVTDARGRATMTYDAAGNVTRVTASDGSMMTALYDAAGRVTESRAPSGRAVRLGYDMAGRLTSVTDGAAIGRYDYDGGGNVRTITQPSGRVTSYEHDTMGRPISRTGGPLGMASERTTYDRSGRPTRAVLATGDSLDFAYDVGGRLREARGSDGLVEAFDYAPGGRRIAATTGLGRHGYAYDMAGRLSRAQRPDGLFLGVTTDAAGRVASLATATGTTRLEWGMNNKPSAVVDASGGRAAYAWDAQGRVSRVTYPSGATATYTYDARGRVARILHAQGASTLLDEQYTRDASGRITRVARGTTVITYEYATNGQLAAEVRDGVRTDFAYDADGNLTRAGAVSLSYDPQGRLTAHGADAITWDAAGRMATRRIVGVTESYRYDTRGRMTRIDRAGGTPARIELMYDGDGNLARVTSDGAVRNLVWDTTGALPLLVEETDGAGALLARYTWGAHGLISRSTPAGVQYAHTDARGTVRAMTDATGAVIARGDYTAWGTSMGPALEGVGFAGEWRLPGTDLLYLRARFYEPRSGRFITPDPATPEMRDPLALNAYLYSLGDPVNRADPTGRFSMGEISTALTVVNVLATVALSVWDSPESIVLNALGIGKILTFATTVRGVTAMAGISGLDTRLGGGPMVGISAFLGVDAYYDPPTIAFFMQISPYVSFGLPTPGAKFDRQVGFIIGKAGEAINAGRAWNAVEGKIAVTCSRMYAMRNPFLGRIGDVLRFIALRTSEVTFSWTPGDYPDVAVRGQAELLPTWGFRGPWKSIRIALEVKWTFAKIDASAAAGTSWNDLFATLGL